MREFRPRPPPGARDRAASELAQRLLDRTQALLDDSALGGRVESRQVRALAVAVAEALLDRVVVAPGKVRHR
jgi:hypothetical protein